MAIGYNLLIPLSAGNPEPINLCSTKIEKSKPDVVSVYDPVSVIGPADSDFRQDAQNVQDNENIIKSR